MTLRKTHSLRHLNLVAAIAVAALIAAACGGDDAPTAIDTPSDTAAATTVVDTPVRGEHPCDTGEGQIEGNFCLIDGQWYADAGAGHWVESDGPPATTTTTVAEPATESAVEQPSDSGTEQVCIDDACVDVPEDGGPVVLPEGTFVHPHPKETEPDYQPDSEAVPEVVPEPETEPEAVPEQVTSTTVAPEPDPEPEETTSTTLAPDTEPEPTSTTTAPEPEPTSTTLAPEPDPTTTTTPQPPTTTAPLPEQVGETVYLVLNPDDLGCHPVRGCYEPVHLEVGSHVVWLPIGGSETTGRVGVVTSLEIDALWSRATVDFCTYDPSWGGYNWTRHGSRVDPDGGIRIYNGGDYRGAC